MGRSANNFSPAPGPFSLKMEWKFALEFAMSSLLKLRAHCISCVPDMLNISHPMSNDMRNLMFNHVMRLGRMGEIFEPISELTRLLNSLQGMAVLRRRCLKIIITRWIHLHDILELSVVTQKA
jgi:hypothetical protein